MRSLIIFAMTAAAALTFAGCDEGSDGSSSESGENAVENDSESTLAEKLTANIATGNYAMDLLVTGGSYGEDMPYKLIASDGDIKVAMTYQGVYTEFYTVDGQTYMIIPDICFYEKSDGSAMPIDSLFVIGEGDTLSSASTEDGTVTEVYTSSDDSDGQDTYTFTFDEESGELKSFKAENGGSEISVEVNSVNWVGAEIELPDLTGWKDISDVEGLDDADKLKLSLYYMGVTEEKLAEAGYTYDQLAELSDDELKELLTELGVNIFN